METIQIPAPDDFHVTFRQGPLLSHVVPETAKYCGRALVMPNTDPAIQTAEDVRRYRKEILAAKKNLPFLPLMTVMLTEHTTAETIKTARQAGVVAAAYYFEGLAANAGRGSGEIERLFPVFEVMRDVGMVLSLNGDKPGPTIYRAERMFAPTVRLLANRFRGLKIVVERVSTVELMEEVLRGPPTLAATITAHHLLLTKEDVFTRYGGLNPHLFCRPIPKNRADRSVIQKAVLAGNRKCFFASGSEAYLKREKESGDIPCGIFTAPVALPLVVEFFDAEHKLDLIRNFTSGFGVAFYGLPPNDGTVVLERVKSTIPATICDIVPLRAGETVSWRVKDSP